MDKRNGFWVSQFVDILWGPHFGPVKDNFCFLAEPCGMEIDAIQVFRESTIGLEVQPTLHDRAAWLMTSSKITITPTGTFS